MHFVFQIVLYQLLFLGVYQLIKREPFFQLNRMYLLVSLGASFIFPFIDFTIWQIPLASESITQLNSVLLPEVLVGEVTSSSASEVGAQLHRQFYVGLEIIYWVGLSISLSMLYVKLKSLYVNIDSHMIHLVEGSNLIYLKNSTEAFSVFNYIFLGDQLDTKQKQIILTHEQAHVRFHHSLDNILLALFQVVMWFNPLIFLYQRELQLVHEYQADAKVCEAFTRKAYTMQLLNFSFSTHQLSLMSPFYTTSLIKNRITMLQKKSNHISSLVKYAIITPVLFLAFTLSLNAQENLPEDEQALLEKYKKVLSIEFEKEGLSNEDFERIFHFEKDESGRMTKEGFYKLRAAFELTEEKYSEKYKIIGSNFNEDYESYLKNKDVSSVMMLISSENEKEISLTQNISAQNSLENTVPFASVFRVPIYPGCSELEENEELRKCMSGKITDHVNTNFNLQKAKNFGILGVNRVYVRFTIDEKGVIERIDARSSHPELSEIGKNAIASLPKMEPGINNKNEAVSVVYTLPITFQLPEEELNQETEIEKN